MKKNIYISKKIHIKEKDLNESQLDFFYLSSPSIIEKKIENLDSIQYFPMDYSKIYLNLNSFIGLKNKFVIKKMIIRKKNKNRKNKNINQKVFILKITLRQIKKINFYKKAIFSRQNLFAIFFVFFFDFNFQYQNYTVSLDKFEIYNKQNDQENFLY